MNTPGLVSVIIPSYNCEEYINTTINSVLAQDYHSIELLIIDDESTDKTKEIINSYGDQIRLISQNNSGVCSARNRGIQEARGQYICLMDHDDYWYPDKISRQIKAFELYPETGIVYSNFGLWNSDSTGAFPSPDSRLVDVLDTSIDLEFSGWIYHLLLLDCWVLTSTAMIRSEVFQKCGVFDEALPYSEDWELWFRVSREYRFLKLNSATTLYRQHIQQGNKKLRLVDYRTILIQNSYKKWGLSSQDGRKITKFEFSSQLAAYQASFGLHHLIAGNKRIATTSLFKAWVSYPINFKYIAYLIVGLLGWKPRW